MNNWTIFQSTTVSTRTRGKPLPTSYLRSHLVNVLSLVISYPDTSRMPKQPGLPEKLSVHSEEQMVDSEARDSKHLLGA